MFVVEVFLPVADNAGYPFPRDAFDRVRRNALEARFDQQELVVRAVEARRL